MCVFFFLTLQGIHNKQVQRLGARIRLQEQSQSAIEYLLFKGFETKHQEQFAEIPYLEGLLFYYEKKYLGQYQKIKLLAANRADTLSFDFLIAASIPINNRYGLQLKDYNKPLNLSGATLITGQCVYPKRGIEKIYINTIGYSGSYSEQYTDTLNMDLVKNNFLSSQTHTSTEMTALNSQHNSFNAPVLRHHSLQAIQLQNISLSGNILLESDSSIHVKEGVSLDHVSLKAPTVVFENASEYRVHVYASDTLLLGEGVVLSYPSSLVVEEKNKPAYLECAPKASVSGVLKFIGKNLGTNSQVDVRLAKESTLYGELYIRNAVLANRAKIYGTAVVDKMILKTRGTLYQSALLNAYINPVQLPEEYLFTLPHKAQNFKILQWLH